MKLGLVLYVRLAWVSPAFAFSLRFLRLWAGMAAIPEEINSNERFAHTSICWTTQMSHMNVPLGAKTEFLHEDCLYYCSCANRSSGGQGFQYTPAVWREFLAFWGTWAQNIVLSSTLGNSANTDLICQAKVEWGKPRYPLLPLKQTNKLETNLSVITFSSTFDPPLHKKVLRTLCTVPDPLDLVASPLTFSRRCFDVV